MDFFGALGKLLGVGNNTEFAKNKLAQPNVGGNQTRFEDGSVGQRYAQPDITYNPNPNTNIPYSANSVADAKLGNQYVANPTAPQFLGVDPARFGFPADNSAQGRATYQPVQGAGAIDSLLKLLNRR